MNTAEILKSLESSDDVKLLGTLVVLSLGLGSQTIPRAALIDGMKSSNDIPDEWIPKDFDDLSLYLQTVTEESKRGINGLIINDPSFDKENHVRYQVDKAHHNTAHDKPFIHRVQHFTKKVTEVEEGKIRDVQHADALLISLVKDNGSYQILVEPEIKGGVVEDTSQIDISQFKPLIDTIQQRFNDKLQGQYGSKQIGKMVRDSFNAVGADPLQPSTWFLRGQDSLKVQALADLLTSLHPGIRITTIPITVYEGNNPVTAAVSNVVTKQVQVSVEKSILSTLVNLDEELDEFMKKDKEAETDPDARGTNASTYEKRYKKLKELKSKVEDYRANSLLINDMLDEHLDSCEKKLMEVL